MVCGIYRWGPDSVHHIRCNLSIKKLAKPCLVSCTQFLRSNFAVQFSSTFEQETNPSASTPSSTIRHPSSHEILLFDVLLDGSGGSSLSEVKFSVGSTLSGDSYCSSLSLVVISFALWCAPCSLFNLSEKAFFIFDEINLPFFLRWSVILLIVYSNTLLVKNKPVKMTKFLAK